MAVATVQFRSEAMGRQVSYNVILPEGSEGPYPVLIQLHGLGDDHHSWIHRSNLARHVADLGLAVVLPDGASSGYLNWKAAGRLYRQRYEDLIMTDITAHVKRHFHVTDGPWAIGGLSMGGQGALRIGMKHSDQFASIWAHSAGGLHPDPDWLALLDDPEDASSFVQTDRLKARVDAGASLPSISFDCGVDDFTLDGNRDLHAHMEQIGLSHTYHV